ncbi:cathepsin B [Capsaspora owczarzaki ATCC 30864]|uniref:Cathepsin B n=1 Tax=Capsaspora owczarzaki (strain ATCC 30864) TaxID=595528 RepID=A0A0D2U6B5_CAPO3|nr:cathepsin B [Capsaspora owczarzaki ATCC 30864]KJE90676.1 cathepsin B [Capsaspora owczarzaki ATCC 30864]|eukprot:XP_004364814.1 cathepsin B [Capsaspora owczarzaki ATCC 30864]
MRAVAVIAFLGLVAVASAEFILQQEMIDQINNANVGWTAGVNPRFAGKTREDIKGLLGTKLLPKGTKLREFPVVDTIVDAIPTSFDARTQWPASIHPIRDQQQCGSCWAFGATEALSDRLAIASNNSINVVLSPQDLVSCDSTDYGCDGGYPINAWHYMQSLGVVTDTCYPYTSGNGDSGTCQITGKKTPACATATFYKAKTAYQVANNMAAIQSEILANGPVEAAFSVYDDFFSYTSGVYSHQSGALDGGHAVKIVGWGVDGTTPYWIVANSWGTSWGQAGFFWIKRGNDECGIEDGIVAGLAAV